MVQEVKSCNQLADLVVAALSQDRLSGLSAMLEILAKNFSAAGSILFELVPDQPRKGDQEEGNLYVLAEWFEGRKIAGFYDLSLRRSVSGRAIRTGEPQWIDDAKTDKRVSHHRDFIVDAGIQSLASLPVGFADGKRGALGIYRANRQPFSDEEKDALDEFAVLVPSLYEAVRNRVSFELVQRTNLLLQRAPLEVGKASTPQGEIRDVLENVTHLLTENLNCLEASIYLRDPQLEPDSVHLQATTWRRSQQLCEIQLTARKGLTAWVVRNRKPLALFDLRAWPRQREAIRRRYPGLWWDNLEEIERQIRADPRMEGFGNRLPPLSFMAVPIIDNEELLGAIRCLVSTRPPYLFANREIRLLEIVAAQIGNLWRTILRRRDVEEENQIWRRTIQGLAELNAFTVTELAKPARLQNPQALVARTLELTRSAITDAGRLEIRLEHTRYRLGSAPGAREPRVEIYEGSGPEDGAGTAAPDELLVTPISDVGTQIGVLEVTSGARPNFTQQEQLVARLLGRQLGLYLSIADAIDELKADDDRLRTRLREIQELQAAQNQAYEDLSHQLKSPIFQALARIRAVVARKVPEESLSWNLEVIRSRCRQAKRVVRSLGLFADLAKDGILFARTEPLTAPYLEEFLIEAASDAAFVRLRASDEGSTPRPTVRFHVERERFNVLKNHAVLADRGLLEHAVNNLLDNAGKYSYENSQVVISGGLTKTNRFYISVTNVGLKIRADEVKWAVKRGWRGTDAMEVTSEGTGIGLWLVDQIMQAHNGSLQIEPTRKDGQTEIKLIFPTSTG